MSDERLMDITRRLFGEVFNRGDLNALNEFVAENLIEHEPTPPGTPQGREGLRQWVMMMRKGIPDFTFDIQEMVVNGDKVWIRSIVHGKNSGELMGMPASGKTIQADVIDIVRYDHDQVVEHWGVMDQLTMMQQMGIGQSTGEQHG
jgi:steroid delta-isomerase-like uncharacterized protein